MSRASLLTLLAFALAGAVLGLYLGWEISPVQYVDVRPARLQPAYQDDYALMIAAAFNHDGNLDAARARLARLGAAPAEVLAAAARRLTAAAAAESDLRRLAFLAAALDALPAELQPYAP